MAPIEEDATVLAITEGGYGKRTDVEEYRIQTRAGKGIKAMNLTEKTGKLAGQLMVREDDDILIITDDGVIIRTPASSVPVHGRATQGVRMMRVAEESRIVSIERAAAEPEEAEESVTEETGSVTEE